MGIISFYKRLFDKSYWDEKDKAFHCNFDDLIEGMKQDMHYYQSCLGVIYFSSKKFTQEEIDKIEEEDKKALDVAVDNLSKEINQRIIENLLKDKKWKDILKM